MYNTENTRAFQKELDLDQHRRVRESARVNLRKQRRETQFREKRRAIRDRRGRVISDIQAPQPLSHSTTTNTNTSNTNNNNNNNFINEYHQQQQQGNQGNNNSNNNNNLETAPLLAQLPNYVQGCIQSNHPGTQFECVQKIRQLLSVEGNALQLIGEVIHSGVVPRLVQFLRFDKFDRLQFESAWALTNIASGNAEHTAEVIKNSAIPLFVELVSATKSVQVIEQAIWALGNIAGDSIECRNLVLDNHALNNVWQLLNSSLISGMDQFFVQTQGSNDEQVTNQHALTRSLLRNTTWTVGNMVRGKPPPEWEFIELAVKSLVLILQMNIVGIDEEINRDACWAFSYLTDIENNDNIVPLIVNSGALKLVIDLLGGHHSDSVRHPSLRCVGNVVTGTDVETQNAVNCGLLPQLLQLLNIPNVAVLIRKEACWTVSNVTAGNQMQIEQVIRAKLVPTLIIIMDQGKFDVRKEAAWALSNITSGGSDAQIRFLVHQNIIAPLCKLFQDVIRNMNQSSFKMLVVLLEAIHNILEVGDRDRRKLCLELKKEETINEDQLDVEFPNKFADILDDVGGVQALEDIQSNPSLAQELFDKAQMILSKYFDGSYTDGEEEDDDEDAQFPVGFDPVSQPNQNGPFNPFSNSGTAAAEEADMDFNSINSNNSSWPPNNSGMSGDSNNTNTTNNTNQSSSSTNGMSQQKFNF